jgi:hypothetical protein
MQRKLILTAHISATVIAVLAISTFFILSMTAEISGNQTFITSIKRFIFFSLPVLFIVMPTLAITGNSLAGKSKNPKVLVKKKRMKFVMINGILLVFLASILYYRAHNYQFGTFFVILQIVEFCLGLTNLFLIGLNIRSGFQLHGKSSNALRA